MKRRYCLYIIKRENQIISNNNKFYKSINFIQMLLQKQLLLYYEINLKFHQETADR